MRLGFDPELFLRNKEGKFISSIGLIGGTKDVPQDVGEGCALQEDNVTVEFNTPVCASAEEAIRSFTYAKDRILEKVAKLGLSLAIVPSAVFDHDQLANPQAQQFGCEPDYNAWSLEENPRPQANNANLRSAGGHIHVETELNKVQVIRALDVFVGAWLTQFDTDVRRRELYGKAGAFRPKTYGVEYRTPSCFWISSDDLIRRTWAQVEKAVKFVEDGSTIDEDHRNLVEQAINESNKDSLDALKWIYKIES